MQDDGSSSLDQHYALTNHCCRRCCGPILQSGERFVCAVCGATAAFSPVPICGCGLRPQKGMSEREGYFRCTINPNPSPANPARIVIGFACEAVPREGGHDAHTSADAVAITDSMRGRMTFPPETEVSGNAFRPAQVAA